MEIYESTFIVDGKTPDAEVDKIIEKMKKVIADVGGELVKVDKLGKRELAYKLGSAKDGNYVYLETKLESGGVVELERNYKITDSIIRYLTVRKEFHKPPKVRKKKTVSGSPASSAVSTAKVEPTQA